MIRREDVADLLPGDVVEVHRQGWTEGTVVRGPIVVDLCHGELSVGYHLTLDSSVAEPSDWMSFPGTTLTVVSRAPRPLYVNHPRTEPVPGDVVRDADSDDARSWRYTIPRSSDPWVGSSEPEKGGWDWASRDDLPARLRLLVDGDTGDIVLTVQS